MPLRVERHAPPDDPKIETAIKDLRAMRLPTQIPRYPRKPYLGISFPRPKRPCSGPQYVIDRAPSPHRRDVGAASGVGTSHSLRSTHGFVLPSTASRQSQVTVELRPTMGSVSIRRSIRWLPDEASEPTATLVLTSPQRRFVDLRIVKPVAGLGSSPAGGRRYPGCCGTRHCVAPRR